LSRSRRRNIWYDCTRYCGILPIYGYCKKNPKSKCI